METASWDIEETHPPGQGVNITGQGSWAEVTRSMFSTQDRPDDWKCTLDSQLSVLWLGVWEKRSYDDGWLAANFSSSAAIWLQWTAHKTHATGFICGPKLLQRPKSTPCCLCPKTSHFLCFNRKVTLKNKDSTESCDRTFSNQFLLTLF